jgi:hypothetical protein
MFGLIKKSQLQGELMRQWTVGYDTGKREGESNVYNELEKQENVYKLQIQTLQSEIAMISNLLKEEREKMPITNRRLQMAKEIFLRAQSILDSIDYEYLDMVEFHAKKSHHLQELRDKAIEFAKDKKLLEKK